MLEKRAIYAGSFDCLTQGHMWMIEHGSMLFDELIVVVANNPSKNYYFDLNKRVSLVTACTSLFKNVRAISLENKFLVDLARELEAGYFLRGIRNSRDFDYEREMSMVNRDIWSKIFTIFLLPPDENVHISSSLVKSIIGINRWEDVIWKYVPIEVLEAIREKENVKRKV